MMDCGFIRNLILPPCDRNGSDDNVIRIIGSDCPVLGKIFRKSIFEGFFIFFFIVFQCISSNTGDDNVIRIIGSECPVLGKIAMA